MQLCPLTFFKTEHIPQEILNENVYKRDDKIIYKYLNNKYVKRKQKYRLQINKVNERRDFF